MSFDKDIIWALIKEGKNEPFKLVEIVDKFDEDVRVTEHWYGEHSYSTKSDNIFLTGSYEDCKKALIIYNKFVTYQEKRFKKVLMLL